MTEREKGIYIFRNLNRKRKRIILRRVGFLPSSRLASKTYERFEQYIRECSNPAFSDLITGLLSLAENEQQ